MNKSQNWPLWAAGEADENIQPPCPVFSRQVVLLDNFGHVVSDLTFEHTRTTN